MKAFRFAAGLLLGATLISTGTLAAAQDFPKGPIKLIVPVPAGGGVDLFRERSDRRYRPTSAFRS